MPAKHRYTPLHLQLLLHYHCSAEPYALYDSLHANSPAVRSFRYDLEREGLLREDFQSGSGYATTRRGKAFIKTLLTTPLPEDDES